MQCHNTDGVLTHGALRGKDKEAHARPGWDIKQRSLVRVLGEHWVCQKLPKELVSRTVYWAAQQYVEELMFPARRCTLCNDICCQALTARAVGMPQYAVMALKGYRSLEALEKFTDEVVLSVVHEFHLCQRYW
jgi:hypothetical protein